MNGFLHSYWFGNITTLMISLDFFEFGKLCERYKVNKISGASFFEEFILIIFDLNSLLFFACFEYFFSLKFVTGDSTPWHLA